MRELKVAIKLETKILGDAKMPGGRTELTLSDGQKIVTDLYLPTTGLIPNSSYVPHNLLNANGFVVVDEFLRVKGTTDVWAVGDVSSVQRPQFVNTDKQSVHVVKNIGLMMKGKELVRYSTDGGGMFPPFYLTMTTNPLLTLIAMLAVPLGRKAGTGHMGSMKLPSFMVHFVKGKTYFTEKLGPTIDGSSV